MSSNTLGPKRRFLTIVGTVVAAGLIVTGCTSNDPEEEEPAGGSTQAAGSSNDEPGERSPSASPDRSPTTAGSPR